MRDFIDDRDLSKSQRFAMLEAAWQFKHGDRLKQPRYNQLLGGQQIALTMTKPSLRTRTSFTVAIRKLGGNVIEVGPQNTKLGKGEAMEEWAAVLGSMVDGIVARVHEHSWLEEFRRYSGKPVINALSDDLHPCQALADAFTVWEAAKQRNLPNSATAAQYYQQARRWCWIGDGNNVCVSLMLTCASLGVQMTIAGPAAHLPPAKWLKIARDLHPMHDDGIVIVSDAATAVEKAEVVFTDTWVSMGQEEERGGESASQTHAVFLPYQVNAQLMARAKSDAIFLHCLPAEIGQEVTADVLRGPRSRVITGAENRLSTTLAILSDYVYA